MSPPNPPLNPSQTVERIREIIVGRHLERLEQRVSRLECGQPPLPSGAGGYLDDFRIHHEARLEAMKDNVHRMVDSNREQLEAQLQRQREETQKLAIQIQQVAAQKAETSPSTLGQLESKIGTWLGTWQASLQKHLNEREHRLANQLRDEVATLWENTESQLTRLESRAVDRDSVEERFARIALAARALAECASPTPIPPRSST